VVPAPHYLLTDIVCLFFVHVSTVGYEMVAINYFVDELSVKTSKKSKEKVLVFFVIMLSLHAHWQH
jgi:hypothetical protein